MALNRYGQVPDVEDRVSDALAVLVEGSHRFKPQPGRDGTGYYLRYVLAEVLADEPDGSVRAVARALARRVALMPVVVQVEDGQSREEALAEALCWFLGGDGTFGWHEELPSAESLRRPVEDWVARVARQRGVWPSQRAAISALVLHGASPREARAAARATFAAR